MQKQRRRMVDAPRNTGGDYMPKGLLYQGRFEPVPVKDRDGQIIGQSQVFALRKDNSYTDAEGVYLQRQPLDLLCTTFSEDVMKVLTTLEIGDKVDAIGFLEPSWRGFIANNTQKGLRFPIPDLGREPEVLDDGSVIQPTAEPFRADTVVNAIVYDQKQFRVNSLVPAVTLKSNDNLEADPGTVTGADAFNAATAGADGAEQTATGTDAANQATAQQPPFQPPPDPDA